MTVFHPESIALVTVVNRPAIESVVGGISEAEDGATRRIVHLAADRKLQTAPEVVTHEWVDPMRAAQRTAFLLADDAVVRDRYRNTPDPVLLVTTARVLEQ